MEDSTYTPTYYTIRGSCTDKILGSLPYVYKVGGYSAVCVYASTALNVRLLVAEIICMYDRDGDDSDVEKVLGLIGSLDDVIAMLKLRELAYGH